MAEANGANGQGMTLRELLLEAREDLKRMHRQQLDFQAEVKQDQEEYQKQLLALTSEVVTAREKQESQALQIKAGYAVLFAMVTGLIALSFFVIQNTLSNASFLGSILPR